MRTKSTGITGQMLKDMQVKLTAQIDKPFSMSADGSTEK